MVSKRVVGATACSARGLLIRGLLTVWLIACCCGVSLAAEGPPRPMTLVQGGRPNATIVVASGASDVVVEAAKELQTYLEKMSGAKLPIAHSAQAAGNHILVGRMPEVDKLLPDLDRYDLGHDGVVLKTFPNTLVVTGKSDGFTTGWTGRTDCGTPNAVYTFLETLGCRWYAPGPDGEVVPRKITVTIPPLDIVSKPDFLSRSIGGWAAEQMGGQIAQDFRAWRKRNRLSTNRYHEGHGLWPLMNPKDYFQAHPEYFGLVEGERQSGYAQPCTSNPDVVRVVAENFVNLTKDRPPQGWRSYPVGQNDSSKWCQCERCQALDGDQMFQYDEMVGARVIGTGPGEYRNVANRFLIFVNSVAERIEKTYPDYLVTTYGYYCLPGFPEVKPRDNVLPVMTHFWDHPEPKKMIMKWAAMSRQLMYYGYVGYKFSVPKFGIVDDIRWCHQQKGVGMTFAEDEHSCVNMVTCYLIARAMWDVNTDATKVLAEFYATYYGRAARPMKLFYEKFDAATRASTREWDIHARYPKTLTPRIVAQCRKHLTEARKRARRPVVERRIESVSKYWRAVELHIAGRETIIRWRKNKTDATAQAVREAARNVIDYVGSVSDVFHFRQRIYLAQRWLRELEKADAPK